MLQLLQACSFIAPSPVDCVGLEEAAASAGVEMADEEELSSEGDDAPEAPAEASQAEVMRDLDAEETEKLVQLRDMIGIDDVAVCRALLESKGWDLEATAREQLGIPGHREEQEEEEERRRRSRENRPVQSPPRAPDLRVVRHAGGDAERGGGGFFRSLLEWSLYLFTLPVTFPFRIVQSLYSVFSHVLGFPALSGPAARRNQNGSAPFNPLEDVRRFVDEFVRAYLPEGGQGQRPNFRPVTYSQVLEEAKRDLKFLLVYLHSPEHQDTGGFCRQTLCSQHLLDFLSSRQVLLWGCSVESGEGHRVSQAMREGTYPFFAVIVLRQNRMMMVGRVEGRCTAQQLTQRLEEIMQDNEAYVVAARIDREERNLTQSIRAEQDAAFQETLRQDQEKERKKREAEEERRRQEEDERRLQREEQERRTRIRQLKIELVSEIPEEPDPSHPDALRILIKLPGGQRLERRFLKTQSLKFLYYFVFCHPDSPDEFDITTNFPKKVLRCKPEEDPESFEDSGIEKSTMLFVHDLEA